jgi:hypothetical protein
MAEQASRDEYWANTISEWRASGLSQKEFCQRRGISDRALNNWLYKSPYRERVARVLDARAQGTAHEETPRFVPVSVVATPRGIEPQSRCAAIEVVLQSGLRIVVPTGFDDETLRRILATLEARPC